MPLDNNYPAPANEVVFTDRSNQRKGIFCSPVFGTSFFSVADIQRSYRDARKVINAVTGNNVSAAIVLGANHVAIHVTFATVTDGCSIILRKSSDNSIYKQWDNVVHNDDLYASGHEGVEIAGADIKVEVANKVGAGATTVYVLSLS